MEPVAQASEGAAPPATPRSRRPWVWVAVVVVAAVVLWVYPRVFAPTLVGTWSNRATENQITFTFNDDGSGAMTIGTAQLQYHYRVDRTHDPAWLDLDATVENKSVTVRAIVEFSRGDKLKIRMFHKTPGTRPTEFIINDVDDTILLTRVEPTS
jgi:uncharacterized protein (TIGR03067 family)